MPGNRSSHSNTEIALAVVTIVAGSIAGCATTNAETRITDVLSDASLSCLDTQTQQFLIRNGIKISDINSKLQDLYLRNGVVLTVSPGCPDVANGPLRITLTEDAIYFQYIIGTAAIEGCPLPNVLFNREQGVSISQIEEMAEEARLDSRPLIAILPITFCQGLFNTELIFIVVSGREVNGERAFSFMPLVPLSEVTAEERLEMAFNDES